MTKQLMEAIAFFRKHAGGIVGQNLLNAFTLAKAEQEANARGWHVEWEDEDLDPADCFDRQEDIDAVRSGKWLWLYAYVDKGNNDDNDRGASCGAISVTGWSDPYIRVMEAELYSETLSDENEEIQAFADIHRDMHAAD